MDESDFIGCCPTNVERPKMNDRSLLLPLNKITYYFKKWTTAIGIF